MPSVSIINQNDEERAVEFQARSYRNLMELIVNELYENIGDCRGKGLCGSCHVAVLKGSLEIDQLGAERTTLNHLGNTVDSSRLACQIMTDESIDGMIFQILGDV